MTPDREKLLKEHHVFKRSFLKEAEIHATFPEIDAEQMNANVREFLNFAFKVDPTSVKESVEDGVEITTKNNDLRFKFERNLAEVSTSGKDYRSFKESILKFSRPLAEYARMVAKTDQLSSVSVTKVNSWKLRADNPSQFIQEGLEFIFRKGRIAEMPKIEFPVDDGGPKKVSIVSNPIIPNIEYKLKLVLEVCAAEDNYIEYNLITKACSNKEVDIKSFPRMSFDLNNFLYWVFIDMMSDNVLELMEQEE